MANVITVWQLDERFPGLLTADMVPAVQAGEACLVSAEIAEYYPTLTAGENSGVQIQSGPPARRRTFPKTLAIFLPVWGKQTGTPHIHSAILRQRNGIGGRRNYRQV